MWEVFFLKRDRRFFLLFAVLGVFLLCFIFYNSAQSKTASHKRSFQVLKVISKKKKSHAKKTKRTSFWKQLVKQIPFLSLKKERGVRKLAHLLEYAALGWDLYALSIYIRRYASRRRFAVFLLFCVLVPCADELIQYFVPGRTAAFSDVCIDWMGMLIGVLLSLLMYVCVQRLSARRRLHTASQAG